MVYLQVVTHASGLFQIQNFSGLWRPIAELSTNLYIYAHMPMALRSFKRTYQCRLDALSAYVSVA